MEKDALKNHIQMGKRLAEAIIEKIICLEEAESSANLKEIYNQKKCLAAIRRGIQDFIMVLDSELSAAESDQ